METDMFILNVHFFKNKNEIEIEISFLVQNIKIHEHAVIFTYNSTIKDRNFQVQQKKFNKSTHL